MKDYFERLALFNQCVKDGSSKNFTDGHHTFEELYYHRMVLSAMLFKLYPDRAWKSKKHDDEENNPMFDGCFIVGIDTPEGQATYHYKLEYWDVFDVKELEHAPEYDGHTPQQAIERIKSLPRPIEGSIISINPDDYVVNENDLYYPHIARGTTTNPYRVVYNCTVGDEGTNTD